MFRLTQYMKLLQPTPATIGEGRRRVSGPPQGKPSGPVVIWNLIRRCNLVCKHCYSLSADVDFKGELSTEEAKLVIDDLKAFAVPALILSGGEPLLRPDIFELAHYAKAKSMYLGLSSNGTLITDSNIDAIAAAQFDYVGVSLDGLERTHDFFRQKAGAFEASWRGIELCRSRGIKVGVRTTLTQDNAAELPALLTLLAERDVDKFYLSHLNYAGRGRHNRKRDAFHQMTRDALDLLFDRCWHELQNGIEREYVTGNNDADGVYLLQWARQRAPGQIPPERIALLQRRLEQWGGNSSGVNIANIDNLGNVHPDTFWWNHDLGNVRQQPFSAIWRNTQDPIMQGLRQQPRPLEGRCAECHHQAICGGNTRIRALQLTGNPWAEDPACYLSNAEIGIDRPDDERLELPARPINFIERNEGSYGL